MTTEQLEKINSLAILIRSFSEHAITSGEGSPRDHFVNEIKVANDEIGNILITEQ